MGARGCACVRRDIGCKCTYIWHFLLNGILKDLPEYVDGGTRFNGDARLHAIIMDETDEFFGRGLRVGVARGRVRGCRVDGGFVVEAIEVTAGFLEVLDPSLGLWLVC